MSTCRICACTDTDCSFCIVLTGEPCWWVQPTLCSACASRRPGADELYLFRRRWKAAYAEAGRRFRRVPGSTEMLRHAAKISLRCQRATGVVAHKL